MEYLDAITTLRNPPKEEDWWISSLKLTKPKITIKDVEDLYKEKGNKLWEEKKEITKKIGIIINSLLFIENYLDEIIQDCFFNKDFVNEDITKATFERKLFEELLLKKEFFTIMNKWNVFRGLSQNHPFFEGKDVKSLLTRLRELIEMINRLAHGEIIFKELKYPILPYYKNGYKEQELSTSFFKDLNVKFKEVASELSNISIDLRKFYQKEKNETTQS